MREEFKLKKLDAIRQSNEKKFTEALISLFQNSPRHPHDKTQLSGNNQLATAMPKTVSIPQKVVGTKTAIAAFSTTIFDKLKGMEIFENINTKKVVELKKKFRLQMNDYASIEM